MNGYKKEDESCSLSKTKLGGGKRNELSFSARDAELSETRTSICIKSRSSLRLQQKWQTRISLVPERKNNQHNGTKIDEEKKIEKNKTDDNIAENLQLKNNDKENCDRDCDNDLNLKSNMGDSQSSEHKSLNKIVDFDVNDKIKENIKKKRKRKNHSRGEYDQSWICAECKEAECAIDPTAEQFLICEGVCRRIFHYPCAGLVRIPPKNETWICDDCKNERHSCAICQRYGNDNEDVYLCSKEKCGNFFHISCLTMQNIEVNIIETPYSPVISQTFTNPIEAKFQLLREKDELCRRNSFCKGFYQQLEKSFRKNITG